MRTRTVGDRNETTVAVVGYNHAQRSLVVDGAGYPVGYIQGVGPNYQATHGASECTFLTEGAALDWIAYRVHDAR